MKDERKFKREDVISPRHNTNIKVVAKKNKFILCTSSHM